MSFWTSQNPQFSLGNLQDEMNKLVERVWHAGVSTGPFDGQKWAPTIDLYEHADHYTLMAELPGVTPAEVDVSYVGSSLTIRGRKEAPAVAGESARTIRAERRFGAFCRTVELPGDIDVDRVAARFEAGVLTVTIPKSATSRPRSVRIDVPPS